MLARLVWEVPNCPGDICPYLEYLSCYLSDFDETLNVAFWEHLVQISTIKLTFVKATFVVASKVGPGTKINR